MEKPENQVSDRLQTTNSGNITSNNIDDETANKLRGDAIGDTMYSEVFVLKTLMQFSELTWSKEVEDDLCFLWDMTEEKDVCKYLFQVSYPSIACSAIVKYAQEQRFVEIVIGILANLLCSDCDKKITEEEICTVFTVMTSDDPLILIQVMRFIHAVSYMHEQLPFITCEVMDQINFILLNSTNSELLSQTLKVVASVTKTLKEDLINGDLLQSILTGHELIWQDSSFELRDKHQSTKHFVESTCNLCAYIENSTSNKILTEVKLFIDNFISSIRRLLEFFSCKENLLPLPEEFVYFMEGFTYIFRTLEISFSESVVKCLCEILEILKTEEMEEFSNAAEFLCYFIASGDATVLKNYFSKSRFRNVLIEVDKKNLSFDFDYKSLLKVVLE